LFEQWLHEMVSASPVLGWMYTYALTVDWVQIFQLTIIGAFILGLYRRFVRQTQSEHLLKGMAVVTVMFLGLFALAVYLKLHILTAFMGFSIQVLIFALIVTFQPEIRRVLSYMGQPEFLSDRLFSITPPERKAERFIHDLIDGVKFLSRSRTGALIVLESPNSQGMNYLEAGTAIDAKFTTELLLTIFHPKTPLHDGAVIIDSNNRIMSAGVLLPLTEDPKLSWQYGTRHRAAIGLTELSDSACIVVSEETGHISFVREGQLKKTDGSEALQKHLEKLYKVSLGSAVSVKRGEAPTSLGAKMSAFFTIATFPDRLQKIFSGMRHQKGTGHNASHNPPNKLPKSGMH